ncbi:hypothetical protein GCM10019017_02010 [Streptomyces showdoensis]
MTRYYVGGGALLSAVLALWLLLFRAGMSVYRTDVVVLGGLALVPAAAWVWIASRPLRTTPPREAGPVPAPPGRLPWNRFHRVMPFPLGVGLVLPSLSVVTEPAIRPDGDDLRRLRAIQEAGAEVVTGSVVSVHRLTRDDPKYPMFSGDFTVEVPVRTAGGGTAAGRVEVVDGHLGRQPGGTARRAGADHGHGRRVLPVPGRAPGRARGPGGRGRGVGRRRIGQDVGRRPGVAGGPGVVEGRDVSRRRRAGPGGRGGHAADPPPGSRRRPAARRRPPPS